MRALLELTGLEVEIEGLPILRGVDLQVRPGEILGVVGETGAGKSMTARAILDLLPSAATVSFRTCTFGGADFIPAKARQQARGHRIGFVPQRPRGSLNPVFRVGKQLVDTLRRLRGMARREAKEEALNLFRSVRITDPERVYRSYPHELSGGMCQRVCIAIALAGEPELIIADEPTTGLDVTIQAEILKLLEDVIAEHNAAGMLITHDLGVVADVCDRVAVMYAGRVVKLGYCRRDLPGSPPPVCESTGLYRHLSRLRRPLSGRFPDGFPTPARTSPPALLPRVASGRRTTVSSRILPWLTLRDSGHSAIIR